MQQKLFAAWKEKESWAVYRLLGSLSSSLRDFNNNKGLCIVMEQNPSCIFLTKKILGMFSFSLTDFFPPPLTTPSLFLVFFLLPPPLSFTAFLPLVLHWKPLSFSYLLSSLLEATTTAALVKRCYLKPSSSLMLCKGIINHARKRKLGSCGFN